MIQLHARVNDNRMLEVFRLLADETKKHMQQFAGERVHISNVPVSQELRSLINAELAIRGISPLKNILAFKRMGGSVDPTMCHVDGNPKQVCNCSVVIPVQHTQGTLHYWYDGEYDLVEANRLNTSAKTQYYKLEWRNQPTFLDSVTIQTPTLTRTNIPHGVTGRADEYRLACTIRFVENESFEFLSERLSAR